jgi:hypothetical protein
MRAVQVLALVVVAAGCLLMGGVAQAGVWSAGTDLGAASTDFGTSLDGPADVAMDASGTAVATWVDPAGVLRAATRTPGGGFGPGQLLAASGASDPHVALDGTGRALVVWSQGGSILAAERVPGTGFAGLGPIATGTGPDVAYAGPDDAVVAWTNAADSQVHAVFRRAGAFTGEAAVSAEPGVKHAHVAGAGGHGIVAWLTSAAPPAPAEQVSAALRSPGGTFGAPQVVVDSATLPAGAALGTPKPVMSPDGHADMLEGEVSPAGSIPELIINLVVWTRPAGASSAWVATRAGASGGAPFDPVDADIATGRSGDAAFAGVNSTFAPRAVETAIRLAGASDFADGAPAFAGTFAFQSAVQTRISPLSGGRYVVVFRHRFDVLATAGRPAGAFEAPASVSAGTTTRLVGLASSPTEAVLARIDTTNGADPHLVVALYDDAATPPAPAAAAPARAPTAVPRDTAAPTLSRVAVSPKRFRTHRVAGRGRAVSPIGTRISWRVSEAARITFTIERSLRGFRSGSRCVASRARRGTARRCVRHVAVGSFARSSAAGSRSLRFRGILRRRALRAGSYRLSALASDAAGNRSRVERVAFTVRAR